MLEEIKKCEEEIQQREKKGVAKKRRKKKEVGVDKKVNESGREESGVVVLHKHHLTNGKHEYITTVKSNTLVRLMWKRLL